MRIDPRLVIEFCTIADEGSFTKAAARLRVAQPWLSTRLRRLEGALGFSLVVRNTRRVALTAEGTRLYDAARALASASEAFDTLARQLRTAGPQRLRLGAPPYTKGLALRKEMIDRFVVRFPRTQFELQTGWSATLQDQLRKDDLDAALAVGDYDPDSFEGILLCEFGLSLAVAADHPLAALPEVAPRELAAQTVHVFTRSLNPTLWDRIHAPLIDAGVRLVERPEVAEGGTDGARTSEPPAVFLDIWSEVPSSTRIVRLLSEPKAPLYLLRRRGNVAPAVASLWAIGSEIAKRRVVADAASSGAERSIVS